MFKKLKEIAEGRIDLLTVRCTNAWLEKKPEPTLFVEINDEMEVLITSRDRKEHFKAAASPWLAERLERFKKSDISEIKLATKKHPLEVFTGDTSLVLVIEGKKYLCSIYRDIYPKGWLVPGGCSRSREELFNPKILISRECGEEILITDQKGTIYPFSSSISEMAENVRSWQKEGSLSLTAGSIFPLSAKELSLAKSDAQNIVIRINGREEKIENISVMIDTEVSSASACVCLEAVLPIKFSELRLFDGEKSPDKNLLNRPIRLTDEKDDCKAIFSRGNNLFIADWVTLATAKKAFIPSE